jgi:TonB family protein
MLIALLAAAAALPAATPIDIGSWFSERDYPFEAMKKGTEGSVRFDVDVGADGNPTACRVVKSSGSPLLDQTTCDVVRARAHFKPAVDKDGKPVNGHYSNVAIWVMPKVPPSAYRAMILDFRVDPQHPSCTIETDGPAIPRPTCAEMMAQTAQLGDMAQRVVQSVVLVAMASGKAEPFHGKPEWGTRISFLANETYNQKSGYSGACISVAAEGTAAGTDACKGFPGAHTISEEDKKNAIKIRTEISVFAIARASAPRSKTCRSGESAAEVLGCN